MNKTHNKIIIDQMMLTPMRSTLIVKLLVIPMVGSTHHILFFAYQLNEWMTTSICSTKRISTKNELAFQWLWARAHQTIQSSQKGVASFHPHLSLSISLSLHVGTRTLLMFMCSWLNVGNNWKIFHRILSVPRNNVMHLPNTHYNNKYNPKPNYWKVITFLNL